MAKLKTKKGVAKRFHITKTGKIKYMPAGKSHLLSGKEASRIRRMRRPRCLEEKKERHYIKRMLPYG